MNAGKSSRSNQVRLSRRGKTVPLARLMPDIARTAWRSRGFINQEIVARWVEIVGEDIAGNAVPLRLSFPRGERMGGTLEIRVTPAFAPMLQHSEPRIIERVNRFFGYGAVARIKLQQGPVQRQAPPKPPAPPSPPDPQAVAQSGKLVKPIKDDKLRELLERWGAAILQKKRS